MGPLIPRGPKQRARGALAKGLLLLHLLIRERDLSWRRALVTGRALDPDCTGETPTDKEHHHHTPGPWWPPWGLAWMGIAKWVPRGERALTNTHFRGLCFLQRSTASTGGACVAREQPEGETRTFPWSLSGGGSRLSHGSLNLCQGHTRRFSTSPGPSVLPRPSEKHRRASFPAVKLLVEHPQKSLSDGPSFLKV